MQNKDDSICKCSTVLEPFPTYTYKKKGIKNQPRRADFLKAYFFFEAFFFPAFFTVFFAAFFTTFFFAGFFAFFAAIDVYLYIHTSHV